MSKDNGPTILYDPNFILDSTTTLDFVNECVDLAKKLNTIVGGISLKLVRTNGATARFMWAGKLFLELYPAGAIDSIPWLHFRDLASKTIGRSHCDGAARTDLWEKILKPNLRIVIQNDMDRLNRLFQGLINAQFAVRLSTLENPQSVGQLEPKE